MFTKSGLIFLSAAAVLLLVNLTSVHAQGDLGALECFKYSAICITELKLSLPKTANKTEEFTQEYCCNADALKLEACLKKKFAEDPKCKDVKMSTQPECAKYTCPNSAAKMAISTLSVGLTLVGAVFVRFLFY